MNLQQPKAHPVRRRSSNIDRQSFSPIKIEDPHPPSGVNLTGVPRRVKDRCADIYNTLGKWHKIKLRGARLIKEIAIRQHDSVKQEDLLELCDSLLAIVEDLGKLVDTLCSIHKNFDALSRMHVLTHKSDLSEKDKVGGGDHSTVTPCSIPFINVTLQDFARMSCGITEAYRNELMLKKNLIKKVPNLTGAAVLTFASVCWMHDALIDESVDSMVLVLVAECGFQ